MLSPLSMSHFSWPQCIFQQLWRGTFQDALAKDADKQDRDTVALAV